MHFGEFNPLEVLAAAAVQRGGNSQEVSSGGGDQGQTSTSDVADNEDNPDDPNKVSKTESANSTCDRNGSICNAVEVTLQDKYSSSETKDTTCPTLSKTDEGANSKELKPLSVMTTNSNEGLAKSSNNTPSYVIKMVTSNGNKVAGSRSMVALKDATKIIIPNKDGSSKTLTVLKINKPASDKSSSTLQILNEKPKGDDDEGYCSRSSLDSPGQCSRSDSEICEQENADIKSPVGTVGKNVSPLNVRVIPVTKADCEQPKVNSMPMNKVSLSPGTSNSDHQMAKKPAKIVIVSRDSNIKNIFSDSKPEKTGDKCSPSGEHMVSPQGGTVLRSLLGEKSVKSEAQQSTVISPGTNVTHQNKAELSVEAASTSESKSVFSPTANYTKSGLNETLHHTRGSSQVSLGGASGSGVSIQGTGDEVKHWGKVSEEYNKDTDFDDKRSSPELDTNRNCLSSGCDGSPDHKFKVPACTDSLKCDPRKQESPSLNKDNGKTSTIITRSSENTPCTTPSTVVRIVCANKATFDEQSTDTVTTTAAACSVTKDSSTSLHKSDSSPNSDTVEATNGVKDLENVATGNNSNVSEAEEKIQQQKAESFQNAFKTFLSNGKPVDLADLKGLKVSTSGGAFIVPESVLTSLNAQSQVRVSHGGPASQLVTSLASQVLATSHAPQLSKSTIKHTVMNSPTVVIQGKEDEEIVDVTSLSDASPSQTDTKESLKLASSLNQTQVASVVRSIPANNNVSLFTNAISGRKENAAAKTIPVLINTTNGKRLANIPVTTLVSASTGQNQKPVTYLVMPPQGKGGASLLLPQQFKGPTTLQAAQSLSNIPKYQYIIQDDVPPVIQQNSGSVAQSQTVNLLNYAKPHTSDSWTVLATVDTQGVVSTPGQSTAAAQMAKSKTVPVLIKKPLGSDLSLNTNVLHNSIVVSSKGPQSLIPKLVGQSMYQSQKSFAGGVSQSNLLVNPNDILKTDHMSQFAESVVKLKNQTGLKITDSDRDSKSAIDFIDQSPGETFIDSSFIQSIRDSSQLLETNCSEGVKVDKASNKTPAHSAGRCTPSITGRITPLHSLETAPSENTINIKITGSKVIDMRTSEDLSKSTKKQANIGKFGSLSTSWAGLQKSESVAALGKSGGLSRMSSPVLFDSATTSPTSSIDPWSPNPMSPLQIRSDSELDMELLARPCPKALVEINRTQAQGRRKLRGSTSSTPDLSLIKESQGVSRLHPLIDHDYCMFSEFSADIQSSIIATTESKKKIEKYNQKAKAARTKEGVFKMEKNSLKMKKRKYAHRLPLEELRKIRQDKAFERRNSLLGKFDSTESRLMDTIPTQNSKTIGKIDKPIVKRHSSLEKKILSSKPKRRDNKSYVKITGSFQDDFVYYATKNTRGRPRKYHDSTNPQVPALLTLTKKPPVGGINVFDWYRDLSKTDKSSKFGVPEDPLQVSGQAVKADPYVNGITDKILNVPTTPLGGHTPVHESEVADLVMQMMPNSEYNTSNASETDEFIVSTSQSVAQSETVVASTMESDSSKKQESTETEHGLAPSDESPADLENMVEQVRNMLNSMGEAELTMLGENLSNSIPSSQSSASSIKETEESIPTTSSISGAADAATDYSSLNAFLGPYNHDGSSTAAQATGNSFDLDDINDSDLLPSDIGNMNMILGDLNTPKSSASNTVEPKLGVSVLNSPIKASAPLSLLFSDSPERPVEMNKQQKEPTLSSVNAIEEDGTIDKSEFFPEVNSPVKSNESQSQSVQKTQAASPVGIVEKREEVQSPPELTTVSMFWNDLPGLMIQGKQCVRLVDIHKQMLPAKDTGILKKRCQMMNLDITNCSELERDFLIRYANAAKSKSCVVVVKADAQALVSFYVNPRPRITSMARHSTGDSRESSSERPPDKAAGLEDMGPATPATVCSEYEPEIDNTLSPKYVGGKGKGKSSRPHSASSERASTPSSSSLGKGKCKGGGKGAQKRKLSPQLDHVSTHHPLVSSFSEALPSMAVEPKSSRCELSHPSTPQPVLTTPGNSVESLRFLTPPDSGGGIKRSERTRNRKVNYAALNCGMYADEGILASSGSSLLDTQEIGESEALPDTNSPDNNNHKIIKVGSSLLNQVVLVKNSPVLKTNAMTNITTVAPVIGQVSSENRYNFQEEIEIRRLRNKQKRRGLNNTEKKKLERLRERLSVKVKNLKRKLDHLKKNSGLLTSPKKILVRNMNKSEQVGMGDGETREVEETDTVLPEEKESGSQSGSLATCTKTEVVNETTESQLDESESAEVSPTISTSEAQITASVSAVESTNTSESMVFKTEKCKDVGERAARKKEPPVRHRMPLRKVIFPVLHRSNQRGRMQVGNLHYHLYHSRESACIQCTTCSDFLTVRKFLKHMHHHNSKDELCTVALPHKLEMAVLEPSADQTHWWGEFQKKRSQLEASPAQVKASSRTDARKASRDTVISPKTEVVTELPQGGLAGEVYCVKVEHMNSSQSGGGSGCRSTPQGVVLSSPTPSSPGLHLVKVESQTTLATSPAISVLNVSGHAAITATPTTTTSTGAGTRQSTRVRKRKQLHPIESYIYTQANKPSSETPHDSKRLKLNDRCSETTSSLVTQALTNFGEDTLLTSAKMEVLENLGCKRVGSRACLNPQSVLDTDVISLKTEMLSVTDKVKSELDNNLMRGNQ